SSPKPQGTISIPGGPESLVIDNTRGRAYTHKWNGGTVAVDLQTHKRVATWPNGCSASRGIALDETRGFLFAGCAEGKVTVMDLNDRGALLASLEVGKGVDVIAYNARLGHLYLPGADSATMAVVSVSPAGKLSLLTTVPTVKGAHCVTADDRNNAWICDPGHGRLLRWQDRARATR
ncbi:MAG TPA: hypothetical protein VF171_02500, partial [Trueperaceae bacterium]